MQHLPCPWCGKRDETEFSYGGFRSPRRPDAPETLTDAEWAGYLFMTDARRGLQLERWGHVMGCRMWFYMVRNSENHVVLASFDTLEKAERFLEENIT